MRWKLFFQLLCCSFILNSLIFYNGFYFINGDSGSYITHQFLSRFNESRSKFYSIFLFLTNFNISLFLSVLIQGLIICYGIYLFYNYLLKLQNPISKVAATSLILLLFSTLPWFVSIINPDIFTSILTLFVFLLFYLHLFPKTDQRLIKLIVFISISVHSANIILAIALIILFGIIGIKIKHPFRYITKQLILYTGIIWLTLSIGTYINFGKFSPNPTSHVFVLSRLAEMGVLKEYLQENCETNKYELCNSYQNIEGRQWIFMWDSKTYPHAIHGWTNPKVVEEYNQIILSILKNNYYRKKVISISWHDFILLFINLDIEDGLHKMDANSSPYQSIQKNYAQTDYKLIAKAKQQMGNIPFPIISKWLTISLLLSIVLTITILIKIRIDNRRIIILLFLGLFCYLLIVNNITTSALSTYLSRFQNRIIWLLPFITISSIWIALNKKNALKKVR